MPHGGRDKGSSVTGTYRPKRLTRRQPRAAGSVGARLGDMGEMWGRYRGDIGGAIAAELLTALGMQVDEANA